MKTVADVVERLSTREDHQRRDLHSTAMQLRADSLNEQERSIECVLATENPITVFDWEGRQFIDEVLVMRGMQQWEQIPLLDNHNRWSLDDVFGSIRSPRVDGYELIVRLFFADLSELKEDDQAARITRAWIKVKQRHQREVSIGYRVLESVTIPAGQTQEVMGRRFTARQRPMRIATKWVAREGSLTPVGADQGAIIRTEENPMNPLLKYLISIGLRTDATMGDAWTFAASRTDPAERAEIRRLIEEDRGVTPSEAMQTALRSWADQSTGQQNGGTRTNPTTGTQTGGQEPGTNGQRNGNDAGGVQPTGLTEDQVRQMLNEDRERSAMITRMFQQYEVENPDLQRRAISEGWNEGRVATELLPLVRQRSSQPVGAGDGLWQGGIHVRAEATAETLGLALMYRSGVVDLDHRCFQTRAARSLAPAILRRDVNDSERQRAMEAAEHVSRQIFHAVDFCRMALQVTKQRIPHDTDEMIRAAMSSGAVQDLFTTNVNAGVLMGYTEAPDSTMAWTRSEDKNDFRANEGITMGKFGALTVHAPGKTADDLDIGADKYEYRLYRYSGQWKLDEMDIINDRLNGLNEASPEEMGRTAARLRPNLVYSRLLANGDIKGAALFSSGRANLFEAGSVMGITSLEAAAIAFGKKRIRDAVLDLKLRHVIVPADLAFKTETVLVSVERRNPAAETDYGTYNPISRKGIQVHSDDRIGVAGCVDPETQTAYAGTATNWFAAGTPGEGGAKTIVVGYRTGTNRSPRIRGFVLDRGQWGLGWDINMDIGCGVEDYLALQKHTGAGA